MTDETFELGQVGNVIKEHRYGFIHVGDRKKYFLHESAMKGGKLPPAGTRVRFLTAPPRNGEKLERAVNVEVL